MTKECKANLARTSARHEQLALKPFGFCYTVLREENSHQARDELSDAIRTHFVNAKVNERSIPSRFFYDDAGTALYERITCTEDYYLTRCEREIFRKYCDRILNIAVGLDEDAPIRSHSPNERALHIIELGAGDGHKTAVLVQRALQRGLHITYRPIDISERAMTDCAERILATLSDPENGHQRLEHSSVEAQFTFHGIVGDFFEGLGYALRAPGRRLQNPVEDRLLANAGNAGYGAAPESAHEHARHLVMFIGSSIGNFDPTNAIAFCKQVRSLLQPARDHFLVGFDLRKPYAIMHRAYSDREGITAEFNRNLLRRVNRELGSNFNPAKFEHFAQYNVRLGAMESFLVATEHMRIVFPNLAMDTTALPTGNEIAIELRPWEAIHTEYSWKYTLEDISALAQKAGFSRIAANFFDSKNGFVDSIFAP